MRRCAAGVFAVRKGFRPPHESGERARHATALAGVAARGTVDVEVFSSEVGLRKPDPEIYHYATRLGVEVADCLFVGDGSYRELSGAAAVGMHAVLVLDPSVDADAINRPEVEDLTGPRIAEIAEVRSLLSA